MTRKLDIILVIDVEATCWSGAPPAGQETEIIEIGLCTLDVASGQRLEKRSILVKPEVSRVSAFCTELTSLTQKQVDKGVDFAKACQILEREYQSRGRIWASYGQYDRNLFARQCTARQVDYPFGVNHLNVKTLFAVMQALPFEIGMAHALEHCGLPLEGRHHRGADDAWNIAHLLSQMLLRRDQPVLG